MDSTTGFGGFAAFIALAVVTGVIVFLAWSQAKIKREIEESRRLRERDELAALGRSVPGVPGTFVPPPDASGSIPEITPGGTPAPHPHHPHHPGPIHDPGTSSMPDTGSHHGGFDGGGHSGGFDGGGSGGGHGH